MQKLAPTDAFRAPLSGVARDTPEIRNLLTVPRSVLGATNRTRGYANERDVDARATRYALRELLRDKGHPVERAGDEVDGISRHALRRGLGAVADDVLKRRGVFAPLSEEEVRQRMDNARDDYEKMRRLSLPRNLAGEVLEMLIVLDRAAMLEEAFGEVRTCRVWGDDVSVRNLACFAWR